MQSRHPRVIAHVRGRGLMVAFELASPGNVEAIMKGAFQRGLLVLPTGSRAIRLCPPLVVSADEVGVALAILESTCVAIEETE